MKYMPLSIISVFSILIIGCNDSGNILKNIDLENQDRAYLKDTKDISELHQLIATQDVVSCFPDNISNEEPPLPTPSEDTAEGPEDDWAKPEIKNVPSCVQVCAVPAPNPNDKDDLVILPQTTIVSISLLENLVESSYFSLLHPAPGSEDRPLGPFPYGLGDQSYLGPCDEYVVNDVDNGDHDGTSQIQGTWTLNSFYADVRVSDNSSSSIPQQVNISFNDGTLKGYGGCNWIAGNYKTTGDALKIFGLAMTARACAFGSTDNTMDVEAKLFKTLTQAQHYSIFSKIVSTEYNVPSMYERLILYDVAHRPLVTFTRAQTYKQEPYPGAPKVIDENSN